MTTEQPSAVNLRPAPRFPVPQHETIGYQSYLLHRLPTELEEAHVGQVYDADNETAGELLGFVPFLYSDRDAAGSDKIEYYMVYLLTECWNISQAQHLPKLSRFEMTVHTHNEYDAKFGRPPYALNVQAGSRIFQTEQETRENAVRMMQAESAQRDACRAALAAPPAPARPSWTCWECGCEYSDSRTPDSYDVNGPYCGC